MKKTVVPFVVLALALGACSNKSDNLEPTPTQAPTPTATETTNQPEPTTDAPKEPTRTSDPRPTEKPEPSMTASSSDAGTPATQFAKRWGTRYPAVPEYAILKAANGVCSVTDQYGGDWISNPLANAAVSELVQFAGIAENDAVEFAQDAQQNYCASRENPA